MAEELRVLEEDIKRSLKNEHPELVLDRLHTLTIKVIKGYCIQNNIDVYDAKKELYPLHSLIGMLVKFYSQNRRISDFSEIALKQSISIFEKFNDIRNNKSYAHDNEVLKAEEAIYVINTVLNTLNFLIYLETGNNMYINTKFVNLDDIYKFVCINDIVTTKNVADKFNLPIQDAKEMLIELFKVNGLIKVAHLNCNPDDENCQWVKRF